MANLKSSQKDIRRTARKADRNRQVRSRLKTLAKKLSAAEASGDNDSAKAAAREFVSALDKAAKTNVIHVNQANRHKSHCSKLLLV